MVLLRSVKCVSEDRARLRARDDRDRRRTGEARGVPRANDDSAAANADARFQDGTRGVNVIAAIAMAAPANAPTTAAGEAKRKPRRDGQRDYRRPRAPRRRDAGSTASAAMYHSDAQVKSAERLGDVRVGERRGWIPSAASRDPLQANAAKQSTSPKQPAARCLRPADRGRRRPSRGRRRRAPRERLRRQASQGRARPEPSGGSQRSFLGRAAGRPWGGVVRPSPLADLASVGLEARRKRNHEYASTRRKCRYREFGLRTARALSGACVDSFWAGGPHGAPNFRRTPAARPRRAARPSPRPSRSTFAVSLSLGKEEPRVLRVECEGDRTHDVRPRHARLGELLQRTSSSCR